MLRLLGAGQTLRQFPKRRVITDFVLARLCPEHVDIDDLDQVRLLDDDAAGIGQRMKGPADGFRPGTQQMRQIGPADRDLDDKPPVPGLHQMVDGPEPGAQDHDEARDPASDLGIGQKPHPVARAVKFVEKLQQHHPVQFRRPQQQRLERRAAERADLGIRGRLDGDVQLPLEHAPEHVAFDQKADNVLASVIEGFLHPQKPLLDAADNIGLLAFMGHDLSRPKTPDAANRFEFCAHILRKFRQMPQQRAPASVTWGVDIVLYLYGQSPFEKVFRLEPKGVCQLVFALYSVNPITMRRGPPLTCPHGIQNGRIAATLIAINAERFVFCWHARSWGRREGWGVGHSKTWALVTNGVRARILRGLETRGAQDPIELVSKTRSTHLRDALSDKPGRSFASDGSGRRSAMAPGTDPIQRDMQDFARETLTLLEQHFRARDYALLAIFAAPKMLGILRQELPASLRDAVTLERATNLIGLPEAELRETVRGVLQAERAI